MNNYTLSSIIAFILVGMGIISLAWGYSTWIEDKKSKSARKMLLICVCVFFWNYGYAWMSMSHGDVKWALFARAIALFSVFTFMIFVLDYVRYLSKFPLKPYYIFTTLFTVASLISWSQIIRSSAITFVEVPWGYWYTSHFSNARIIQFASIISALIYYYYLLHYWKRNATSKRVKYIIKSFQWFGPILFTGYLADTLLPTVMNSPAIPGSSIGAFFSALLLYGISRDNKAFDITTKNVSEYVFRDVHTPVLIFDAAGNLVLMNNETSNFFGLDSSQLLAQNMSTLFTPSDSRDDLYEIPDKNTYYRIDTSDVLDRFGDVLYIIVFITDMTAEENAMAALNESRLAAESASIAKSNFLANMSHEIRTPMNAILGMSDIILMDPDLSDELRANISDIKISGTNLVAIINDILNISKIESGKVELIADDYDIVTILQDINFMMSVQTQKKDLIFRMLVNPTIPQKLYGDSTKIREILINVIGNAAKFTKVGSINLSLTWNNDVNDPILTFNVADTGIGIKPEDLDSIFDSFNQVDTRRNRGVEGTGLGLAITKNLARLMGGDVTVKSVYGEGSTFTITLKQIVKDYAPIGKDVATKLATNTYTSHIVEEPKSDRINRPDAKILIVDDNKINLKVAEGIMRPYKMQVTSVLSGYAAIDIVKEQHFDLIFMDHMMPELDGVDTAKIIHEMDDGKYANIPIIALTANTLSDSKNFFLENGMQDFLAKPIDRNALDEIIEKWL